ncbi:hypothetical protein JCM16303_003800 [Sporobolomyces ruberrimus]
MPPPIRLPTNARSPFSSYLSRFSRIRQLSDLSRLVYFSLPLSPSLPQLQIRPFFLLTTFITLVLLSLLGFHPTLATKIAPTSVPFSDKVLHFVCFFIATWSFYRIWKVKDEARKVWIGWRMFNEGMTFGVCCIVGGIFSEFVQSLLPYKTFQFGDVFANLLGSGLGLWISWKRARDQRREKELRRLYVRMDQFGDEAEEDDSDLDEDERERRGEEGQGLVQGRTPSLRGSRTPKINGGGGREREMEEGRSANPNRGGNHNNPWDDRDDDEHEIEREGREIFGLGGDDEDEDEGDFAGRRK